NPAGRSPEDVSVKLRDTDRFNPIVPEDKAKEDVEVGLNQVALDQARVTLASVGRLRRIIRKSSMQSSGTPILNLLDIPVQLRCHQLQHRLGGGLVRQESHPNSLHRIVKDLPVPAQAERGDEPLGCLGNGSHHEADMMQAGAAGRRIVCHSVTTVTAGGTGAKPRAPTWGRMTPCMNASNDAAIRK